jgi:phage portal protein BeeE
LGHPAAYARRMIKASYASIEMQNMEFYQGTIAPLCHAIEAEISRKLLTEAEKLRLSGFNMDAKLRGTTKERYDAYQVGRQGGWLRQ